MMTRDIIRDTASTLAHLWCGDDSRDQQGVTRIIRSHSRSHSEALGSVLCAHIMRYLEERCPEKAVTFSAMLAGVAGVPDEV